MQVNFMPTEEQSDLAKKKCMQIINLLSDIPDVRVKAYILFQLIYSFKDSSGIDITQSFAVLKDPKPRAA